MQDQSLSGGRALRVDRRIDFPAACLVERFTGETHHSESDGCFVAAHARSVLTGCGGSGDSVQGVVAGVWPERLVAGLQIAGDLVDESGLQW